MKNKEYYNKIKRFVYRKLNQLEVTERNDGKMLLLHFKNQELFVIGIHKEIGVVLYTARLDNKIRKLIPLKEIDVEILLKMWVEETFNIEVKHIDQRSFYSDVLLNNI